MNASHDPHRTLAAAADEARRWLFEQAAPRWLTNPATKTPMFPERMTRDGVSDRVNHRIMVQARHIYAFSELGALGWDGPWRPRVGAAIDFLLERARRPDGLFVHAVTAEGDVADARADLYDQAFMLFSLGTAGKALDRPDLFDVAAALGDGLEAGWRHPKGGFAEGEIAGPPRRQNPHMHLLEAFLALKAASGNPRWAALADEIAGLCAGSFIDPATGALLEYFADDFAQLPSEEGRIVEPGHCFEWAWLFETMIATGHVDAAVSDRLVGFARAHGIDAARGVAINEVLTSGAIRDPRARLWPQTERLKAALSRLRRTETDAECREAIAAYDGLKAYLDPGVPGTWTDKYLPDGTFLPEPVPGSSLYHIVCGLAELIRTAKTIAP
jgi:mannose-6-phosphate isomerase